MRHPSENDQLLGVLMPASSNPNRLLFGSKRDSHDVYCCCSLQEEHAAALSQLQKQLQLSQERLSAEGQRSATETAGLQERLEEAEEQRLQAQKQHEKLQEQLAALAKEASSTKVGRALAETIGRTFKGVHDGCGCTVVTLCSLRM